MVYPEVAANNYNCQVSVVDTVSGFVALDRTLSMKALSLAESLSCMVPNRKGPLVNAKGPSMNGSKDQDLDVY